MGAFIRFGISIPMGAFYGWAGAMLSNWFLVPLGAPVVSFWQVWGLILIAGAVRVWAIHHRSFRDPEDGDETKAWGLIILKPIVILIALAIGSFVAAHL